MDTEHDNITALATYEPNAAERKRLIKQVAMAPQATDDEFKLFLTVAERLGLDPLARQIYAIHRRSGQGYQMTIQTGIDGFRSIAADTHDYAGSDDPLFEEMPGSWANDAGRHPYKATVTVWRFVHEQRCAFTASARWDEYCQQDQNGKLTGQWGKMPYNQLAKCAEALALRKGFPKQLSGLYTDDEMGQADNPPLVEHGGRTVNAATGEIVDADAANRARHDAMREWTDKAVPTGKPAKAAEAVNWGPISGRLKACGISDQAARDAFAQWATRVKGKPTSGKTWEQLTDADLPTVIKQLERIEAKHAEAQAALAAVAPVAADEPASDQGEPEPPDEVA